MTIDPGYLSLRLY